MLWTKQWVNRNSEKWMSCIYAPILYGDIELLSGMVSWKPTKQQRMKGHLQKRLFLSKPPPKKRDMCFSHFSKNLLVQSLFTTHVRCRRHWQLGNPTASASPSLDVPPPRPLLSLPPENQWFFGSSFQVLISSCDCWTRKPSGKQTWKLKMTVHICGSFSYWKWWCFSFLCGIKVQTRNQLRSPDTHQWRPAPCGPWSSA